MLVTLAAAAPGADAMAAATAPAPNSIAKLRGLMFILFSLIHFLLCQTIDEFVDVFSRYNIQFRERSSARRVPHMQFK